MRFSSFILASLAACCASLLASCASPTLSTTGQVNVVAADELPAPTAADYAPRDLPYLVGPFDKLSVDVLGMPELTKVVQTDGNGSFTYPLAGQINAAGKTVEQVAQLLAERLRANFVRDPQVAINLIDATGQTMAIDGQVSRPGVYPIRSRMTLMRAVATAGGATELARSEYVVVFRTVADHDMATLYNLAAIRQGFYRDPEIYPNDVVYVGESAARRVFRDVIQASGLIASPLAVILQ